MLQARSKIAAMEKYQVHVLFRVKL